MTSSLTLQKTSCLLGASDVPTFGLHFMDYKKKIKGELVPLPLPAKIGM